MRGVLAVCVIAIIHCTYATLSIKGPSEPVLEGSKVRMECLSSDPDFDPDMFTFEKFFKYSDQWFGVERDDDRMYRGCFFYSQAVSREDGRLFLDISRVGVYEGSRTAFRCAARNGSVHDNSSEPLTLNVQYMRELVVNRVAWSMFPESVQDLRVPLGGDVELECSTRASETPSYFWQKEGDDWLLPQAKLVLKKIEARDGGQYTCTAQHPLVAALSKTRTVSITVLAEDAAWYESSDGRLILMTSAAAGAFLVLLLSISVFLYRRSKQARGRKGPIDDRSQKKPIYKSSVESLPSTAGDNQPLV